MIKKIAISVIIFFIFGFGSIYYYVQIKKYQYYDSDYKRDYLWQNIEVGTILMSEYNGE